MRCPRRRGDDTNAANGMRCGEALHDSELRVGLSDGKATDRGRTEDGQRKIKVGLQAFEIYP